MTTTSPEVKARALKKAKTLARALIVEVNARTVCAHCGKQPIEWHNPEHVELNRKHFRIGFLVAQGRSLKTIRAELERCTPLCRRCHMAEDGRLKKFVEAGGSRFPVGFSTPLKPCTVCQREYKPLRRGLCMRCWHRAHRPGSHQSEVAG